MFPDIILSILITVDHDAVLYEDKMIIYGGKSDAGCVNGEVFVFDITCQKWINVMGEYCVHVSRSRGNNKADFYIVEVLQFESTLFQTTILQTSDLVWKNI